MNNTRRDRKIYLVIAICIAIFAPISLIFVPQGIAEIIYHRPDIWHIFVPKKILYVYGVGYLLLFISMMILYLINNRKISIPISITCFLLSFVPFYVASKAHTSLSYHSISHTPPLSLHSTTYKWDEIEKIQYYKSKNDLEFSTYEFFFDDGYRISLPENGYFKEIQPYFQSKLDEMEIPLLVFE